MNTSSYHIKRLSDAMCDLEGCYIEYKERNGIAELESHQEALLTALKSLLDTRSTPTWLKSADQKKMLFVNPAYTKEFSVTYEDYVGLRDKDVWEFGQLYSDNDQLVLDSCQEMEFEETVVIKGESVIYKVRKWPVILDGVVLGIAGESLGPVHERD